MCGFVVSIGNIKESNLVKATESIKYRGPDDTNYYIDKNKNIFIGHNRLEIMDPDFGKQPVPVKIIKLYLHIMEKFLINMN